MQLTRTTRIVLGGAAALGIAAGAAGIAGAATGGSEPDHASEEQEPSYTSSITVDDTQEAGSEADERAALADLATVSPEEATEAALAESSGTAADPELENENGNVVYGVEVTGADGTITEVIIDAGDASVLATEDETDEGPEDADEETEDGPEEADED